MSPEVFRDLFENRHQFQHFENYLTGLIILSNKSMANITRCVVESSDKSNISRYFSKDRWFEEQVNDQLYGETDESHALGKRVILVAIGRHLV
jgi:hypothetical protein